MRLNQLILMILTSLLIFSANAAEPTIEPHAMVYYQIPLGVSGYDNKKHSFGFREDRFISQPGQNIDYQKLMKQPAVFDFKMGHQGVQALTISGIDYLQRIRVHNANQEGHVVDGDTDSKDVLEAETEVDDQSHIFEGALLTDIFGDATLGTGIGVLIGEGLLTGIGD